MKTLLEQQVSNSLFEAQVYSKLSDLSYQALNGQRQPTRNFDKGITELGQIPFSNQPQDEITKERILDYKKSLEAPAFIDPNTNTAYNLIPSGTQVNLLNPNPILININGTNRVATQNDIDGVEQGIQTTIKNIIGIEENIALKQDNYNNLQKLLSNPNTPRKANINKKIKLIKKDITDLHIDLNNQKNILDRLNIEKEVYIKNIEDNKLEVQRTNEENKKNVESYVGDIKALNRDKFNIDQQPNESITDYLNRIQTLEQEQFDMNLYNDKADLDQVKKLKTNLNSLIKDDVKIDGVVNSFNKDEVFIINKNFQFIKNSFLNTYGFNNKNLSVVDIVQDINDIMNDINNPIVITEIKDDTSILSHNTTLQDIQDTSGNPTGFYFNVIDNSLYIENRPINKHIYLKIGENRKGEKYVFYSKTKNEKGEFYALKERASSSDIQDKWSSVRDYMQFDDYIFDALFNKITSVKKLYADLEKNYKLQPVAEIKENRIGNRHIIRGYGALEPEDIPKYIPFGNIILLLQQLYYHNTLSIKHKSLRIVRGFKVVKVSDNFVDVIMAILKKQPYEDKLKLLKNDEMHLFNSLIFKAGLHKIIKNNKDDTKEMLKERFLTIEGEIQAGNDNPELLKELKDVLLKIYHLNGITKVDVYNYLKQFK